MNIIVSDSGPIIHLYEANLLDLLQHTGIIYIPQKVLTEIESYLSIRLDELFAFKVLTLTQEEQKEKYRLMKFHLLHH
ncbi:MAG: hypothetical protein H7A23_24095 [Leptospiraceae bacterium]|nr:hypothetical protein [Leptospiraceae bacterium]MCP5497647.1 hypothetical protein [Leptospiraceae bacterium]